MATAAELTRLVNSVEEKMAAWPKWPHWEHGGPSFEEREPERKAYNEYGMNVIGELVEKEGAVFKKGSFGGDKLVMAGVSTSCTSGIHGLLRNWQGAARRKILKLQGVS
ncbi:hypothetical protein ACRQ1B_06180 [Rhizobium panacihumi]|uniref:hypothetical protein n=1 Tax=Rhizobium panacihumi TaxID=2008450 RepID=UPI003D79ACD1